MNTIRITPTIIVRLKVTGFQNLLDKSCRIFTGVENLEESVVTGDGIVDWRRMISDMKMHYIQYMHYMPYMQYMYYIDYMHYKHYINFIHYIYYIHYISYIHYIYYIYYISYLYFL